MARWADKPAEARRKKSQTANGWTRRRRMTTRQVCLLVVGAGAEKMEAHPPVIQGDLDKQLVGLLRVGSVRQRRRRCCCEGSGCETKTGKT